jgi:hypothetical protein
MDKNSYGLCLNCAHYPGCSLTPEKGGSRGVRFCEEYETLHLPAATPSPGISSEGLVQTPTPRVLGLCSNCDNYPTCGFAKPEAGVWHCEEYR